MEDWELAVQAAHSRKALDLKVLHIGAVSTFTDHFIICTGTNGRQVQAIADAVQTDLKKERLRPMSVEGFQNADWILLDYGDFVFPRFLAREAHVLRPRTSVENCADLARSCRGLNSASVR